MDTLQLIRSLQNLPSKAAFSEVIIKTSNAANRPGWQNEAILDVRFDDHSKKVIVSVNEDRVTK